MFSLPYFEHQLVMYVTSNDKQTFAAAFDVASVPVVSHEQALAEERTKKLTTATPTLKAPSTGPTKSQSGGVAEASTAAATQKYAEQLMKIPDIKEYGPLLKSSVSVELSESVTEYVVSAVKHVFKENIVVQYDIKNTLPDTVLENVTVIASPEEEDVPVVNKQTTKKRKASSAEALAEKPAEKKPKSRELAALDPLPSSTSSPGGPPARRTRNARAKAGK